MKDYKYILLPALVIIGLLAFQLELINRSVENSNTAYENLVLLRLAEMGKVMEDDFYCYRSQAQQFVPTNSMFYLLSSLAGATQDSAGYIGYGKKDTLVLSSISNDLQFNEFKFQTETRVNMRFDFEFLPLDIIEDSTALNYSEKYVLKKYKHYVENGAGERLLDTFLFDSLFVERISGIAGENSCFLNIYEGQNLIHSIRETNDDAFESSAIISLYNSSLLPEVRIEVFFKNPSILAVMNQWYFVPIILVLTLFLFILFYRSFLMIKESNRVNLIKTDFINMMTHEFNTPITNLKLTIDNYSNKLSEVKRQKLFTIMNMEVERLRSNFQTLFQVNKLTANELSLNLNECELNDLILKTCDAFEMNIQENKADLSLKLDEKNPKVNVDEIHMLNVFSNIVDNSLKYGGENVSIKISTIISKNKVAIELSDNGIGMSKEMKNHAFDKYYRSKELQVQSAKGMGLGLFYVKKIIDLHKGEIELESKEGKGSTVRITLNLSKHA